MTYQEIDNLISSVGIPYAYYQFNKDTVKPTPFICFYFSGDNDFKADNTNFQKIRTLVIELYTDEKDFALENTVEDILDANEFAYAKIESYIDSEKMMMVTYTTDVIITKGENNG